MPSPFGEDWSPHSTRSPRTPRTPKTPRSRRDQLASPRTPRSSPRHQSPSRKPSTPVRQPIRKYTPSTISSLSSVTLEDEPPCRQAPFHRAINRVSRFFGAPDCSRPALSNQPFHKMSELEVPLVPDALLAAKHKWIFSKAFCACCCGLGCILLLISWLINSVMIVHLPA